MSDLLNNIVTGSRLMTIHPKAFWGSLRHGKLFQDVDTFCMFIGYPRSGHSMTGALLSAHPEIILAHELGVMKYLNAGFSIKQIYYLIWKNHLDYVARGVHSRKPLRTQTAYSYQVKGQWQGRFDKLRIIGDKHGEGMTLRLKARPWLLKRLRKAFMGKFKFIHVIRNPYDSITSISIMGNLELKAGIDYYFSLCRTVSEFKQQVSADELLEFRHEMFVEQPSKILSEACRFLGVEPSQDYLADCAAIVFDNPKKSRFNIQWEGKYLDQVQTRIEDFPFLEGYSFDR